MLEIEPPAPASDLARLSAEIRSAALTLGFTKVGFARAEPLGEESQRLRQWLARGYHGEMAYLAREPELRADPRRLLPGARSVVVVALNYYTPHQHTDGPGTGKVSRYAWGDDYHEVLGERLHQLLNWIKQRWPEAEGKVCVDIQRTMDKAWAVRAGLGWMGKHTNVITPDYGSWIFIGELLLNLELEYDGQEVADQCGSCTLCIDACPTGAIVEPYVLNSNLCISHATIESRAPAIGADVAEHLEGWLYGCDVCQDVCPWNHTTAETSEPGFEPRQGNVNAVLSDVLELTPETYAARFRLSAMKRAKISGLQRNARALLELTETRP
jgi:epoxyqueuosine reductase